MDFTIQIIKNINQYKYLWNWTPFPILQDSWLPKLDYPESFLIAPPTIAPTLTSNSPVAETQPGRLECRWSPILNETITYTWRETNNNRIVNSEMEGDVSVVKFNRISRNDARRYTCTVTTAGGLITGGPVQLVVHCKLQAMLVFT